MVALNTVKITSIEIMVTTIQTNIIDKLLIQKITINEEKDKSLFSRTFGVRSKL
jgi:hypothetical protein